MFKQNDPKCLPIVQEIGCFVRAAGAMAELKELKMLAPSEINELWEWAKKSGHVNLNDEVKHSAPIATHALRMLGNEKGQFIEVATFKDGKLSYYESVTEELKNCPKSYIQKIKQNGPNKTHFRNVNAAGELLFDPHFPDIAVQGIFYTIVYAYKE